jgi:broad specificity polyphosphatase/5'/3'-nucleotidase SurE
VLLPIAPLTVQSATSHGVTFHQPLMTRDLRVNERMSGISVDARPADCVKLAIT